MDEVIQHLSDALALVDVYLRSGTSEVAEDFNPKFRLSDKELDLQLKYDAACTEVIELERIGSGPVQKICRVAVALGARWLEPLTDAPNDAEPPEMALIEATLVAEYLMAENVGQDALQTFALHVATHDVWPYWREFLASQCARMNLPKVTLPPFPFTPSRGN